MRLTCACGCWPTASHPFVLRPVHRAPSSTSASCCASRPSSRLSVVCVWPCLTPSSCAPSTGHRVLRAPPSAPPDPPASSQSCVCETMSHPFALRPVHRAPSSTSASCCASRLSSRLSVVCVWPCLTPSSCAPSTGHRVLRAPPAAPPDPPASSQSCVCETMSHPFALRPVHRAPSSMSASCCASRPSSRLSVVCVWHCLTPSPCALSTGHRVLRAPPAAPPGPPTGRRLRAAAATRPPRPAQLSAMSHLPWRPGALPPARLPHHQLRQGTQVQRPPGTTAWQAAASGNW